MLSIESKVFTRIVDEFPVDTLTKYNMTTEDNFSTDVASNTDSIFPFVYIHLLPSLEVGQDLESTKINAGTYTFEIKVVDNVSSTRAKEIMDLCVQILKGMRFNINQMPELSYGSSLYMQICRCRRTIANEDSL